MIRRLSALLANLVRPSLAAQGTTDRAVVTRAILSVVCEALGKRHPNQDTGIQFTRRNYRSIPAEPTGPFPDLGPVVAW